MSSKPSALRAITVAALLSLVISVLTAVTAPTASAASVCEPYPDVTTSNAHCANIAWLKDQHITKPKSGRYEPRGTVNRGSMAAFLFRLTHPGEPSPVCTDRPFKDVPQSHVFCGYIQWAATNDIAFGYADGTYGAARPVTRGAMAALLYRVINPGVPAAKCTDEDPYFDVDATDTFCGVISWMKTNELTSGINMGTAYGTKGDVTRQAMASFLRRAHDHILNGPKNSCMVPDEHRRWGTKTSAPSIYNLGPVADKTAFIANSIGPMFGIITVHGWRPSAIDTGGHPAGLALDFMISNIPNGEAVGYELAEYVQQNQGWIGVEYVIYQQHIWLAGTPFDRWREMEDRGSPTQNHLDHVHVSLVADAASNSGCRS